MTMAVKFPFAIGNGSVMMTDIPTEAIGSQVTFCLGTMVGERVMRPNWGVDIIDTVWSLGASVEDGMREAIHTVFRTNFPDYEVREILIRRTADNPTFIEIEVRFGRPEGGPDVTAKTGTQMPGGTETYAEEF